MAGTKFLAKNISVARDVIKLQYLFRICDVTKSFSEQVLNKPWTYLSPFCSKVTTVASGIPATFFYLANRLVVTGGSLRGNLIAKSSIQNGGFSNNFIIRSS